jgi:hypothetical protein
MATVLEGCINEELRSVVRSFCGQKDPIQKIFIKKWFLFKGEVLFAWSGSQLDGKRYSYNEMCGTEVRKWLRQQLKDFYAAGFDALVERQDNVGAGYVKNTRFFKVRIITCFMFYIHLWPIYRLSLPQRYILYRTAWMPVWIFLTSRNGNLDAPLCKIWLMMHYGTDPNSFLEKSWITVV